MTAKEAGMLDSYAEESSLKSKLALARLHSRRMVAYQMREDVPAAEEAQMARMILSGQIVQQSSN